MLTPGWHKTSGYQTMQISSMLKRLHSDGLLVPMHRDGGCARLGRQIWLSTFGPVDHTDLPLHPKPEVFGISTCYRQKRQCNSNLTAWIGRYDTTPSKLT